MLVKILTFSQKTRRPHKT